MPAGKQSEMDEPEIRILIVEDREDHAALIRALIGEGLKDFQLNFEHVTTGSEALLRLESNTYDICLLDYHLANAVDGLAVLEGARSKGVDTPIVILTAMGDETVAVQAMKAGAKDYLRKEALSPELLRSTMRHTLARHQEERLRKQAQEALQAAKDELEVKVQELTDANEQLRRLGQLKDEFASSVSHELRTPITSLKLFHSLLAAHPEGRDRYLATLRRETERLHFIIEQLLDVARMVPEPPTLKLVPVDLNTLVLLYVADRTLMAEERGLSLTFTGETSLPKVRADLAQLERVLGILLINALNYTPRGGRVEVSTHLRRSGGEVWVGFNVSDTGLGIEPDEQARLFEQFFRGKAALEYGVPGTGLGLSVAKAIVEQHGGEVEIVSEGVPGKGTTVNVWLPTHSEGA